MTDRGVRAFARWRRRTVALPAALALAALPRAAGGPEAERALLEELARSGRVQTIGVQPSERLGPPAWLAPGDPPLLAFRYLEDRRRHRFGELDLMMDDAGH